MKLMLPILIMTLFLGSSCTFFQEKVVPKAKVFAAEKITDAIAKTGECSAVDVIKADVEKLLKIESDESMIVKALGAGAPAGAQEEGLVSSICKAAASLAIPALLQKGVPDKWECKLTTLTEKVDDLALLACGKIPI